MDTTVHAALLGATVVVANAFGGRAVEFMEIIKVLRQGVVSQVTRRSTAQCAELIMWGLKARMQQSGVKVIISVEKIRFVLILQKIKIKKVEICV